MTRTVAFGDIFDLQRRAVPVDLDQSYREVGVRSFGRGLFIKEPVTGVQLGTKRVFFIHDGDLVISNVFGWEGAVAVAEKQHHGLIGSHRFMTWTPTSDVDVRYVQHFLLSDAGLQRLREASPGSAGRNRTLSIKNLGLLLLPLPPLGDQRRIGAYLDSLASTVAVSDSRPGTEALWESMRADPPVGERRRIGDLVQEVTRPVTVDRDVTYPLCGVRWYGEGLFERERKLGSNLSAKTVFELRQGDLVYNRLFAWKQSFAIAEGRAGYVSNEFPTFRIDESAVRSEVLRYLLLTRPFTADVDVASSGTTPTSRNRLKVQDFLTLTVDVPPPAAQDRLMKILHLLETARRAQKRRDALTAALLPAARNEIFSSMR